ncbi:Superoxide dismutase [Mn], mitochondrial OS=Ganoderma microsporum PE=2 SV=1 [Rhizoctonia solani AG-1 IB]|uniref:Superoxide dismutase n=1 Tax=Thanatephorus cucumeris (strain AG1-IB / isolate 7/3/14) TaxID=1108050 RepID=M5C7F9_THACB|nr:superoxide dismutase, Fe-Mn family [Rhizoctonia solani AG-1 IB]CEL56819.1 Superoxide dismutase [Mn], mitochondrial OS=Ganoderma microsporum PE=2 SV=1 [Rhizoctonia solani AG-1 IB]
MATSKVELPPLPYEYNALEPFISEEIMTLHHKKHHQTYVNGYNAASESLSKLVGDSSAKATRDQIHLQSAIKFNGGGHINHSLFWKNLAPASSPDSKLAAAPTLSQAIQSAFTDFQKEFTAAALGIQGSGWAWLAWNTSGRRLEIITTSNQDPVLPPYVPLFGIDMWEHAFYLQYKNVKPDYLSAIWNVINWKEAESRFAEGQSAKL